MAISQLRWILKVQMANCKHKEVILGTELPRELGPSPQGAKGRYACWRKQGLQCKGLSWLREGPKAMDWGVGVGGWAGGQRMGNIG